VARLIAGESVRSVQGRQNSDDIKSKFVNDNETISLREYRHRIKNHLQQVISLIDLKRRKSNSNANVILEQTIGLLQDFIQLNKSLDSGKNSTGTPINMEAQIRRNLESLSSTFAPKADGTDFEVTVEPVDLPRDKVVPLGLIVNELSINSFQHGFDARETPTLSISLTAETNWAELRIQDNGRGLPEDFDWENSYGLTLVKKLTEKQLHGSFEPTNNGGGAGWVVRFPLSDPSISNNGK
jgi:two-component sensor histidine kinase